MRTQQLVATLFLLAYLVSVDCYARDRYGETIKEHDTVILARDIKALEASEPGPPNLYVLGIGGDGNENVFRNEVLYLGSLMQQRYATGGRNFLLINHFDSIAITPHAFATVDNIRGALKGIAKKMDLDKDILFMYLTSHGTEDHRILLELPPLMTEYLTPELLKEVLADSNIKYRVLIISACYSGGYISALENENTMIITASAADKVSFGCGSDTTSTYFGQAWMINGLNYTDNFVAAYDRAVKEISSREAKDDYHPSLPQIKIGTKILKQVNTWRENIELGPALPYPYLIPSPPVTPPAVAGDKS